MKAKFVVDYSFKAYITDAIKACSENGANLAGGSVMTHRWEDLFKPQEQVDAETIINHIKNKINGDEQ